MSIADNANGTPADSVDPRTRKAATEDMVVARLAPHLFETYSGRDGRYMVDLEAGACTCDDYRYREPEDGCKHVRRVLLTIRAEEIPDVDGVDPVLRKQRRRGL